VLCTARVKVVKNKVAPPFKEAEFDIMYGTGISKEGEILDLAVKLDIINKGGSWFSYNETRLAQGRDNVKELLKSNPELSREIEAKVRENADKLVKAKKEIKKAVVSTEKAANIDIEVDDN